MATTNDVNDPPLRMLLAGIRRIAVGPPEKLYSLPPEAYTSSELLALEQKEIFRREWICVGRAEEIPERGDYFTTHVDTAPLIVVRGGDGRISAFSAVCLHRMSVLAAGAGNTEAFVCPYHGWTYDIAGRLTGAPGMKAVEGFEKTGRRLPEIRSEI